MKPHWKKLDHILYLLMLPFVLFLMASIALNNQQMNIMFVSIIIFLWVATLAVDMAEDD